MFVDYPYEWNKYAVKGKVRTFSKDTPIEIIKEAEKINKEAIKGEGKPYFFFEN